MPWLAPMEFWRWWYWRPVGSSVGTRDWLSGSCCWRLPGEDLAAYPWLLHLGLCLLELPVLLWFHLRALDKPLQASPIENIRS